MAYKTCVCGSQCGVRSVTCPDCNKKFPTKTKREKALKPKCEDVDWKDLRKGDTIKVLVGTGPYYENSNGRTYMGLAGKYTVLSIEKEGFFVDDGIGRAFCYMGETKPGVVGIKEAHKVKLIKRHVDEEAN